MNRRDFLRLTSGLTASFLVANRAGAETGLPLPLEQVEFLGGNDAQTLVIYLMGGMSDIIGNMSNFDELVSIDGEYNNYLNRFTTTTDGFWSEAGGDYIQTMVSNGDATIFRTCEQTDLLKAHKLNQIRFMRGNDLGYDSGMVSTMFHVLDRFNAVDPNAIMSNVSFVDSNFELLTDAAADSALPSYLKPVSLGASLDNPFSRKAHFLSWLDESVIDGLSMQRNSEFTSEGGNPLLENFFIQRESLDSFMVSLANESLPDGIDYRSDIDGTIRYDDYNFGKNIEQAMRILIANPDTKVLSMTTQSWDDHSNALTLHADRGHYLFKAIYTAIEHAKKAGRDNLNIILFGDFGRNLKINQALGWDHGNNQCFMWFGGKAYVNHKGVVGETVLESANEYRIFTTPAQTSYRFEPYSIAATFYRLYGIKNPEVLTGGRSEVCRGFSEPFLKV